MWMEIGWALYFQVVGTHKHYMWSSKFFLPQMVGTLKPNIEMLLLRSLPFAPCSLHKHYMWSLKFFLPQMVGTLKPSIEMLLLHSLPFAPCLLPSLPVCYISTICDHRSFFHHRWWGPYEALLWLCEWNLGEQRGSLNRVFFTDLRPFSRIRGLFRGFGPFFGDSQPFLGISSLFADLRIHGQGSKGSERATWRNFRYLIFGKGINTLINKAADGLVV